MLRRRHLLMLCGLASAACARKSGDEVRVAAASNVADVLGTLAAEYHKQGGAEVSISSGSSGKLYAQIENGAPFHAFFSADEERAAKLEQKGLAVPGTRFTYALGRLALVGRKLDHPNDGALDLRGSFHKLAIANPATAPYGVAAMQVLAKLGVATSDDKLVRGENVAQTLQFVDSGAVDLGLVALSNVMGRSDRSFWKVPANLHEPIRQDAVLLTAGRSNLAAQALLDYLKSEKAKQVIRSFGYAF